MGRSITAMTSVVAAALVGGAALAAPTQGPLRPGDVLTYDLAIELQVHVAPAPHSTQPPMSVENSIAGTETITGLRSDPDGSVHASVNLAFRSNAPGQPQNVQRALLVKIAPDGSLYPESGGASALAQYIESIDEAVKLYRNRTLHVGDTFAQTINVPGVVPVRVNSQARVVAQKFYRGYPTFAIETTGNGNIDAIIAGMRASGTVNIAGTTYVDQKDRLLIGQAVRSNVDALIAGSQGNRVTAVATIDLVLDSFKHAPPKRAPARKAAATPAPAPAATPTATPTPTPTLAPNQYYTPTPPAPTPSPVVNPYPPAPR